MLKIVFEWWISDKKPFQELVTLKIYMDQGIQEWTK